MVRSVISDHNYFDLISLIDDSLFIPRAPVEALNDYSFIQKQPRNNKQVFEFIGDYCLLLSQTRDPDLMARIDLAVINCSFSEPVVFDSISLVADDLYRRFDSLEETVRYEHKFLPLAASILEGVKPLLSSSDHVSDVSDYFVSQKNLLRGKGFYRLNLLPGIPLRDQVPVLSSDGSLLFYRKSDPALNDSLLWPYH